MIRYALACEAGHDFESWFRDSAAFDAQAADGLVECPRCGSSNVAKQIMAPALARADRGQGLQTQEGPASAPIPPPADPSAELAALDGRQAKLRRMIRALREEIIEKTEDVGRRFPDEARAMHDGEAPARSIRGQASPEEVRSLLEDGVPILPIPPAPDERN
jgi:hypothetical protein